MRNAFAILAALSLGGISAFSQTPPTETVAPTGEVAAAQSPSPEQPNAVDANAVKAEVDAIKKRRKQEEADLRVELEEAEQELKDLKAREEQLQGEIPKIDQGIAETKKRVDETYQVMTDVEAPYKAAELAAKVAFSARIVGDLQAKYDAEFNRVMAIHVADTNFVSIQRMKPADFDDLSIILDAEDTIRQLQLSGRDGNRARGWFLTMDFERGKRVWHEIPGNVTFELTMQKRNPFVAEALLRFGGDILGSGSTNMLDWDVRVFVGKDFMKKDDEKGRFFFVGASWPVDLGRPVCWQSGVPCVYEVTPKPVRAIADEMTPEIAKKLAEWIFEDEGWIRKKKDSIVAYKAAKQTYDREVILKDTRLARIERKLAENKEKQKDAEQKVNDVKDKLKEYEEEIPAESATPPVVAPAEGATTNAPTQEGF